MDLDRFDVATELRRRRGTWAEIVRATGVSYGALAKLAQGQRKHPRLDTAQKLFDYFAKNPA